MNENAFFHVQYFSQVNSAIQITDCLCILWQTDGYSEVIAGSRTFVLRADELCVLNPSTPYTVHSLNGQLLHYAVNVAFYRSFAPKSAANPYCPLAADPDKLVQAKHILARLYRLSAHPAKDAATLVHALLFALLHELNLHFPGEMVRAGSGDSSARLAEIYQYLAEHYREKLTISQIAEHFFISDSYLSRFFHEKTQKTVMQALTEIRLSHAASLLATGGSSVEEICFQCGFPNLHACTAAFRKAYGQTPSEYRRQALRPKNSDMDTAPPLVHYYLNAGTNAGMPGTMAERYIQTIAAVDSRAHAPFSQKHLHYLHCGPAAFLLRKRTQDILDEMLQMTHFRYLYVSHLLNDGVGIFHKNAGSTFYNYDNLDLICDLILQHNCLPVLELSFMPRQLALHPENIQDTSNYIISMPAEIGEWTLLIDGIVHHLIDRYGIADVSRFQFALWNLPDNQHSPYVIGREEFFLLYRHTYHCIKRKYPHLCFGLGKLMDTTLESGSWFSDFYAQCVQEQCIPDFLGWGFYAIERDEMHILNTQTQIPANSLNADALPESCARICGRLSASGAQQLKKHITDWNACFSTTPLNDSIFRAIYLIRNALIDYPADTYLHGYSLCDSEFPRNSLYPVFSGWNGLFTVNGIPKASTYAYLFLGRLGDVLVQKGEGFLVTRQGSSYQILLYHYQHFCRSLPIQNVFEISNIDYWDYFDASIRLNVQLTLTHLAHTQYHWFEYVLSRDSGSAYDYWRSIGAPPVDNEAMREHLCHRSRPTIFTQKATALGGELKINETLPVLSAKLILLTPIQ